MWPFHPEQRPWKDQEWKLQGQLSPRQPWGLRHPCCLSSVSASACGVKSAHFRRAACKRGPGLCGAWERPPPATLPPVRLWAVPSGLRLPAVWEGGLFVQSSLTVSKSLPGALVPNENVAGLSPATPHPPWSAGPSLPSPPLPQLCPAHWEHLHLTLLHLQLPPLLLLILPAPSLPLRLLDPSIGHGEERAVP